MLTIISIMLPGILTGRLLKHHVNGVLPKVITLLIWVLLFILGAETGGNKSIVKEFTSLGAEAFIITAAAVAGSIAASYMLWRMVNNKKNKTTE